MKSRRTLAMAAAETRGEGNCRRRAVTVDTARPLHRYPDPGVCNGIPLRTIPGLGISGSRRFFRPGGSL